MLAPQNTPVKYSKLNCREKCLKDADFLCNKPSVAAAIYGNMIRHTFYSITNTDL